MMPQVLPHDDAERTGSKDPARPLSCDVVGAGGIDGGRSSTALAWWFLAVALVAGLAFMAVIPPGGGPDEPNHFRRVWQLAHGQVSPAVAPDGEVLESFPACDALYLERMQAHPVPFPRQSLWHTPAGCAGRRPITVSMGNTALNSPATYLAPAAAVAVAVRVGLGVPGQFLAARLASLAAFLAIVFVALRLAPARWRPLLFLVACLPVSLELASTVSSDGMPIALSLLAVALVLRLRADPDAPGWWTAALGVTLVVLAVSKNTYGPLALLIFLVPAERFGVPGAQRWLKRLAAPALAVLLVGWWASQTHRIRHVMQPAGPFAHVDLREQMLWVVHHPVGFLDAVARGMQSGKALDSVALGAVHHYYIVRATGPFAKVPPLTGQVLGALALALAVALVIGSLVSGERGSEVDVGGPGAAGPITGIRTGTRHAIELAVLVVVAIATTLLIDVGVYASVDPIGSKSVALVQGRYFIELFPLVALAVAIVRKERPGNVRWHAVVAVAGSVVLLTAALVGTNQFFYTWRLVQPA
jgi:hypothetical protein